MELQVTYESDDARLMYEESVPPPVIAAQPRRPRVLLVEDDADMRLLVARVLRRDGYDVLEADGGLSLLECLQSAIWNEQEEPVDAIVSDIQMPDLTALEVLYALPERRLANIPVVLMTAYGAAGMRAEATALGAVAVLGKPLDWQQFRLAVRDAVAREGPAGAERANGVRWTGIADLATTRPRLPA